MIHLIDVSTATKEMTDADLVDLLNQARSRNEKQSVTGILLYGNQHFIQILEGNESDVEEIYSAIKNDSRNAGNIVLQRKEIHERSFSDWSMGFKHLTNTQIEETLCYSNFFKQEGSLENLAKVPRPIVEMLHHFKSSVQ